MKRLLSILSVFLALALLLLGGFAPVTWGATGDPLLEPLLKEEIEATDLSGSDDTLITGTAGTSTYAAVWNVDGDLVDGPGVPAITTLANIASVAIPESLVSDTAGTDDLGTDAIFWQKLFLKSEIQFEGATDDGVKTTISVTDPTSTSKTITIPNSDETIGVATSAATDAIDAITEIASSLKSGADTTLITGTAGTNGNIAIWNVDGDLVDGGAGGVSGNLGSPTDKTLSGDILTAGTDNYLEVIGEGAAADDVTEIVANAAGDILVLQRDQGAAYTITVKDGSYMQLQADFALNHDDDTITLLVETVGANDICKELSRANNG